ncbi:winged helix-turn-helix transcriptional regulator [Cumulibacter manganitolerans]|uniref:winged helix-turn-helix transcriptional regulator n=1 Tax=Cumulibacter manganitolerans TaxID=1884992 RepID=UPI001296EE77|nr:helix-turn-helix domain-containing protein [Cumulibacter manganitolerans]
MQWLAYDTRNCSIQRTLDVIGEKWTPLILRETFNGVRRFDQIRDHVGISDAVLADRLRKLVAAGVLETTPYQDQGRRARNEYRLTPKGLDLYPTMIALLKWGDTYCADPAGPSIIVTHHDCGAPVEAVVRCTAGHILESARDGSPTSGPGARELTVETP